MKSNYHLLKIVTYKEGYGKNVRIYRYNENQYCRHMERINISEIIIPAEFKELLIRVKHKPIFKLMRKRK